MSDWDEITDPPRYYDRDGRPLSLRQWSDLYENREYKVIAQTHVGRYWVSTVWLGLDHSFSWPGHEREPLIFETMVFDHQGGDPWRDLEMRRYSTEEEARIGHEDMVALVQALEEPTLVDTNEGDHDVDDQ